MKFSIPFNETIFLDQTRLTLPFVFLDERKQLKNTSIGMAICFGLGIAILLGGSELSTLFFVMGIYYLFILYARYEKYVNLKSAYMRITKRNIDETKLAGNGVFEFQEDCFKFSTDIYCTWIYWEEISHFRVMKSNLLIVPKEFPENVYVIGSVEIGETHFNTLVDFVKRKVKK